MIKRICSASTDTSYFHSRDAVANNTARASRLTREYDGYDGGVANSHYGRAGNRRGEGLRRDNLGVAQPGRAFPSQWENRVDGVGPVDYGRCGWRCCGLPRCDGPDGGVGGCRWGSWLSGDPPPCEEVNDEVIFDHGVGRRDRLGSPARDTVFGGESFPDGDDGLRNSRSRSGLRGSCDGGLWFPVDGYGSRVRRALEPHLNGHNDDIYTRPREDRRDFGRAGARPAARCRTPYDFEDGFEDDNLEHSFFDTGHVDRPRTTGPHPHLLSRCVDDEDVEDHSESEDGERGLRHRCSHIPRATRPRAAVHHSDVHLEEYPHRDRTNPFQPHEPWNRPSPRQNPHVNSTDARIRHNQQPPPPPNSTSPVAVTTRPPTHPANNANRPSVTATSTAWHTVGHVPRARQHAQAFISQVPNGQNAHNGTGTIIGVDSVGAVGAGVGDDGRCDSSESGEDTPDEGSESNGAGGLGGGEVRQSFVHIVM